MDKAVRNLYTDFLNAGMKIDFVDGDLVRRFEHGYGSNMWGYWTGSCEYGTEGFLALTYGISKKKVKYEDTLGVRFKQLK